MSASYCTDAALGTLLHRYDSTAGTLAVTFNPPAADEQHLETFSAVITDVTVATDDGDTLQIDSFEFGPVELWCWPGQRATDPPDAWPPTSL